MKINFKENFKTLGKSCISNPALFERRKNSFLFPLIIFVLCVAFMSLPGYFYSKNVKGHDIAKQLPKIEEPLASVFTGSWDCKIESGKMSCSDTQNPISYTVGDTIKYTVIANQTTISQDTTVVFDSPKDTDNLILFLDSYIRIRYTARDYTTEELKTYELIGTYSKLEGFDFKEISNQISENPELLNKKVNDFLERTYKSTLNTRLYADIGNAVISFGLLVIVTAFMLKSPTLFKRKKGLKFGECMKISLTAALPALIVGLVFMLLSFDFSLIMGFVYLGRIIFIYIKYLFLNKNNIYDILYKETEEERFKLR